MEVKPLLGFDQEKHFLQDVCAASHEAAKARELDNLRPGQFAPSFCWPRRWERIKVCLLETRKNELKVPKSGWYTGVVTQFASRKTSVHISWDNPWRGKGTGADWIYLDKVAWAPCWDPTLDLRAPPSDTASSSSAWLSRAARHCYNIEGQDAIQGPTKAETDTEKRQRNAEQAFWIRWWTEVRCGVLRFAETPPEVAAELRELAKARRFQFDHRNDTHFWKAVNSTGPRAEIELQSAMRKAELEAPMFAAAIRRAKHDWNAKYISPCGVFVAPSRAVKQGGGSGVFSLLLFHPGERIGYWEGAWLWSQDKGKTYKTGNSTPMPLEDFPNVNALRKYGMKFSNVDDQADGCRRLVTAIVDPCRGAAQPSMAHVRENPFVMVNEPPKGKCGNIETASHVYQHEANSDRYALMVISTLPLLPFQELLMHYEEAYERDYTVGERCPKVFEQLTPQVPPRDEFLAAREASCSQSTASTTTPSTLGMATPTSVASSTPGANHAIAPSTPQPEAPPERVVSRAAKRRRTGADPPVLTRSSNSKACAHAGIGHELRSGDHVYIWLDSGSSLFSGWFEAKVRKVSAGTVDVDWIDERVAEWASSSILDKTAIFDRCVRCIARDALGVDDMESSADAEAWLQQAAEIICTRSVPETEGTRIFLARWWCELRWGLLRYLATPVPVVRLLKQLHEARRFIVSAAAGDDWSSTVVSAGSNASEARRANADADVDLARALADAPSELKAAVEKARRTHGTSVFFYLRHGLFRAPSQVDPSRTGLYTLVLRYQHDCIGAFDKNIVDNLNTVSSAREHGSSHKPNIRLDSSRGHHHISMLLPVLPLGELVLAADDNDHPHEFRNLAWRGAIQANCT